MVSRKSVCFGLYMDKTCVPDVFSESPLNTDSRIMCNTQALLPLIAYSITLFAKANAGPLSLVFL